MIVPPIPLGRVYDETKRLARVIGKPIVKSLVDRRRRRRDLAGFSPRLERHPREITDFVDYFRWHEDASDWQRKKGLLISASYGEILPFWTAADYFVPYEARLLHFLRSGGVTRRVFLVGPDLAEPARVFALERTLWRHYLLNFEPRVRTVVDLKAALKELGVYCDMAASLNGDVAYFVKFPSGALPMMVRTIAGGWAVNVENVMLRLWRQAEGFDSWYRRQRWRLPDEIYQQVELDVEAVQNVAEATRHVG